LVCVDFVVAKNRVAVLSFLPNALDDFLDDLADATGIQKQGFRSVRDRYLTPLKTYTFPVVTLSASTSLAAVCTIFETINQAGVRLGPFELLTARFFPADVNLRTLRLQAG
jgi:hypothetical protein